MALGMGLIPIAPIILLPFIIIFFVIIFPIWIVALAVLGLLLWMLRGLNWLAKRVGMTALEGAATGMYKAFRWVLTFGGFTQRMVRSRQPDQ